MLTLFCKNFGFWAVRRIANLVDLEERWKMNICSQKSASIQKRTSCPKFAEASKRYQPPVISLALFLFLSFSFLRALTWGWSELPKRLRSLGQKENTQKGTSLIAYLPAQLQLVAQLQPFVLAEWKVSAARTGRSKTETEGWWKKESPRDEHRSPVDEQI